MRLYHVGERILCVHPSFDRVAHFVTSTWRLCSRFVQALPMRVHHSSSRSGGVTVRDAVAFVDKVMAPPHERGCKEQAVSEEMLASVFLAWKVTRKVHRFGRKLLLASSKFAADVLCSLCIRGGLDWASPGVWNWVIHTNC